MTNDNEVAGNGPPILAAGWDARRAPLWRRVLALGIDWAACWGVTFAIGQADLALMPLLVFLVENVVFIGSLGFTLGHAVLGLRVVRLDGSQPSWWQSLQRSVLLCLVIPAAVWDSDGRGLHDRAAGTAIVLRNALR